MFNFQEQILIGTMSSIILPTIITDNGVESFPDYEDPFESDVSDDSFEDIMTGYQTPDTPVSPMSHSLPKTRPTDPTKLAQQIIRTPDREPSPRPTHFSLPASEANGSNGHRVLRSATLGYINPKFEGKEKQMEEGRQERKY